MFNKLSVIIPARNEENYLPSCLKAIESARLEAGIEVEVIVVLNRCTDNTEKIARDFGAITLKDDSKNLSIIRNKGCQTATSEILVTVDADSLVSKNMFKKIIKVMETGKYVGGGVFLKTERLSLGILMTGVLLLPIVLYWRISAGLFFFSKQAYDAVGGFNEKKSSAEDIFFAIDLKKYAKTQKMKYANLFSASITTSCRKFDKFGDWFVFRRPMIFLKLLTGRYQDHANEIWYDFER